MRTLQSPAALVINTTLKSLQKRIDLAQIDQRDVQEDVNQAGVEDYQLRIDASGQEMTNLNALKPIIGTAFMGSSPMCRTSSNARLDYFLIELDNRDNDRAVNNEVCGTSIYRNISQ